MSLLSIAEIPMHCYAMVVSIVAINRAIERGINLWQFDKRKA